jgi:hypothetical protein
VVSDACPTLTVNFALAEPAIAAIGESLTLTVEASDSGGKPISYAWSVADPTVGTFTNPLSQSTAFTCTAPAGNAIITVTADNGECDTALDLAVSCVTTECGDGIIQPGETCDVNDPATPSCPADCTEICGDGIVEGSEQCEPPNTPVCTATCQHCVDCDSFCGDGIVQPLEACDPPFSGPNCGDLHPQAVAGATLACATIESATCSSCIATEGFDDFDCLNETGNAMAGPAAGQPRQRLCYELLDCVYDTNCAAADPIDCYCGTSGAACQTGGANGLCRAEIERSFESTAFGDIAARFGDPSFAGGVAIIRVDGSRAACGSACGTL